MGRFAAYVALGVLAVSLTACTDSTGSASLLPQSQVHQAQDISGGGPQSQVRHAEDVGGGGGPIGG
jgi:hypothetical protein